MVSAGSVAVLLIVCYFAGGVPYSRLN